MNAFVGIAIAGYLAQGRADIISRNVPYVTEEDLVESEILAAAEYLAYFDFQAYKAGRSPGPCWAWPILFDEMRASR